MKAGSFNANLFVGQPGGHNVIGDVRGIPGDDGRAMPGVL
jgi:hypothetical protein